MKWLLHATLIACAGLLVVGVLGIYLQEEVKPYLDYYGNHASVLGLLVSLVGFVLTIGAVFETLKVTQRAQRDVEAANTRAIEDTAKLLGKVRLTILEETCEQAYIFATEGRIAIRTDSWHRAIEKCLDARRFAFRLLGHQDLLQSERDAIRKIVEDLVTTVGFIERNRLKDNAPQGIPDDKIRPVDSLRDELDKIRYRLRQQLLEGSRGNLD